MTTEPDRVPARLGADALALAAELPLTEDEADYVEAAQAPNTLRGYRSDWSEFTAWCTRHRLEPLPAGAATISGYLTELARAGAKVGTMSRRAPRPGSPADAPPAARRPRRLPHHQDLEDPHRRARPGRTSRPRPASRGFFAALRRSELAALTVDQLAEHPNGLVLALPRSKTNQYGLETELVVLPRAGHPARCPVTALSTWLGAAAITDGAALRPISKGNRALPRHLHPESINDLVQAAVHRVDSDATGYSAHSLRAIAHQTRHRSLATVGTYVRIHEAWADNAATQLGL